MSYDRALWDELNSVLMKAFNELAPALDAKNRDLVLDFIENREYGVALDWLSSIVEERELALSEAAQSAFTAARRLMQKEA